jgi:CRP-like cAMP-binding protein
MEDAGLGTRTEYALPITQVQLADALGLTSVHVNRTLQTLRRDHVVRTEQRNIHIDDWDRLAQLAEFDPEFLLIEPIRKAA